jgi:hypothetical protein
LLRPVETDRPLVKTPNYRNNFLSFIGVNAHRASTTYKFVVPCR